MLRLEPGRAGVRLRPVDLTRVLRDQSGAISHQQALACGLSRSTISRRVASGQWRRLHPRVYLAAGHRRSAEVRVRAAVLWAGPGAAAHGLTAAWWYELVPRAPELVEVTVPRGRQPGRRIGITVRQRDLDPFDDLVVVRDLRVTGIALTALEAAAALGPNGAALLDRALQKHVTFDSVHRAHCRNLGRRGSAAASALLVAAADRAASAAERLLHRLLRAAGVPGWVAAHPVGAFVVDVAFPAERVAVEVDGWAWHVAPERFVRDRQRGNALETAGWLVLRFTWHDLTTRPDAVVAEIRAALATRRGAGRQGARPGPAHGL